jgi:meso-butanediol dehydrogenase / (S,S)-butanediol dehydrogenase / diacetyl reductase
MTMRKLEGKVALITGGGTGIGAAVAKRFVEEGAKVCITGRRSGLLAEVAKSLPAGTIVTCAGDVAKAEDVQRMVATTVEFGGKLDVLVNNAGIVGTVGAVADLDLEGWQNILAVNLTGPFLAMKASIPHMIKAGGGSIINVSSLGGTRCIPAMPGYCTTKAALIMLSQQAALDYGANKIRCNAVCPGWVRTPMTEEPFEAVGKVYGMTADQLFAEGTKNIPLRRTSMPNEVTGLFSYLASDDSAFMTGALILIDGGAAIVDVGMVWRNDPRFALP